MMLNKNIFLHIYKAAYMQRWNDHLRPINICELDKQAHKMIIAYVLGKTEENLGNKIDWIKIIESGIFEFLQRVLLTDIKPSLFYKIKKDKSKYKKLNTFLTSSISKDLKQIDNGIFLEKFRKYIHDDEDAKNIDLNTKILQAAHFLSTKWEFDILGEYNRASYQNEEIKRDIIEREKKFQSLASMKELYFSNNLKKFINICGELRYQIRWNQLYRIPKTSVLGHMLVVAMLGYFFSIEINSCDKRIYNNYFTGLFHDLPEVLTRDIISPIKSNVKGLDAFIKQYEQEEMKKIYSILPDTFIKDLKFFSHNEFLNVISKNTKIEVFQNEIAAKYNHNKFSPRDGVMIEFADKLAALIEAYLTINNGIKSEELSRAIVSINTKYAAKRIYNIDIKTILEFFLV